MGLSTNFLPDIMYGVLWSGSDSVWAVLCDNEPILRKPTDLSCVRYEPQNVRSFIWGYQMHFYVKMDPDAGVTCWSLKSESVRWNVYRNLDLVLDLVLDLILVLGLVLILVLGVHYRWPWQWFKAFRHRPARGKSVSCQRHIPPCEIPDLFLRLRPRIWVSGWSSMCRCGYGHSHPSIHLSIQPGPFQSTLTCAAETAYLHVCIKTYGISQECQRLAKAGRLHLQ